MYKTFFLDQVQKNGDLNADLKMRQYKLDKMAKFMEIKSNNPKLKQSEITKLLELLFSTIQRYRVEINMLSPYRIPSSSESNHTRKQKTRNTNFGDVKVTSNELKLSSNDLKTTSNEPVKKKKNKLKGGANIENNTKCIDEFIHNKYLQMELAMEIISNDKTVKNDTVHVLKEFDNQSSATQAKKGEQLVSMMGVVKKAFKGDDRVEISTANDALKNKVGDCDEKWLQESQDKLLKRIDDEKRANLIMSRKKKQMENIK